MKKKRKYVRKNKKASEPIKRAVGRPRKEIEDLLPEDWKKQVLSLMMEGGSLQEVKALLWYMIKKNGEKDGIDDGESGRISSDLYRRWFNENKDFSSTIKEGIELAQAWWMQQGRINLKDKDFSPVLWYMNMKNRYGWKDKQDITSDNKPLGTINELFSKASDEPTEEMSG